MHKLGLALALTLLGCGKDMVAGAGGADGPAPDAAVGVPPSGYTRLIGRAWDVDVGANVYRCARVTVPHDMYITSIVAHAPNASHHSLLSIAGANGTGGTDGEYDCDAASIGMIMLYASSVGTSPLDFPAGVGLKVAAGQQLHLNLHLLNSSDAAVQGQTEIYVKEEAAAPPQLAEMVLAGPVEFEIPATTQPHEVTGECTAGAPYTLFAVWPHMHRYARHQKVELVRGGETDVVYDEPFSFEEQSYAQLHPMASVRQGDRVRVTCTYVNTSGGAMRYGDGANAEMCFAGLYRYPAAGSSQYCPN